jgi:3-oxoacyl-[acyl-carrier-protein] synthase III
MLKRTNPTVQILTNFMVEKLGEIGFTPAEIDLFTPKQAKLTINTYYQNIYEQKNKKKCQLEKAYDDRFR